MPLTDKVKKRLTDKAKERASRVNASPEAWVNFLDNLSRQRRGIGLPSLSSTRDVSEQPYSAYGLDPTGQFDLQGPAAQRVQLPSENFLSSSNGAPLLDNTSVANLWNQILSGQYRGGTGGSDASSRRRGYMSADDEQAVLETGVPLWYRKAWNRNGHQALPQDALDALTRSTSPSSIQTTNEEDAVRQMAPMARDIETLRRYGLYDEYMPSTTRDSALLQYMSDDELAERRARYKFDIIPGLQAEADRYDTAAGKGVEAADGSPESYAEAIRAAYQLSDDNQRQKIESLARDKLGIWQDTTGMDFDSMVDAMTERGLAADLFSDVASIAQFSEKQGAVSRTKSAYQRFIDAMQEEAESRESTASVRALEEEVMAAPDFAEYSRPWKSGKNIVAPGDDLTQMTGASTLYRAINGDQTALYQIRSHYDMPFWERGKQFSSEEIAWALPAMTEEQRGVFNYLYAQDAENGAFQTGGEPKSLKYLHQLMPRLNAISAEGRSIAQGQWSTDGLGNAALAFGSARLNNLANVAMAPQQFIDALFGRADTNSFLYQYQAKTQNIGTA